jgi:hypothetical protein
MPWPIFSWNSTTGTFPTIIGWGSSASTNLNPGVGLQRPVPLVNDTRALVKLAQQGDKGQLSTGVQSDYDAAKRQLGWESDSKPKNLWLIASAALVILYFILKRK